MIHEKSMFLIMRTSCSNQDFDNGEIAVVELTRELRESISKRKEIFDKSAEKDGSLYEMYFWDSSPDWYEDGAFDELGEEEILLKEKLPKIMTVISRTECNQMIIRSSGVLWVMTPKHTDLFVTTRQVRFDMIPI